MLVRAGYFLLLIIFSKIAFGDEATATKSNLALETVVIDEKAIYLNPLCQGQKSKTTSQQIEQLFQDKLFPGPFDSFGDFIERVKKWQTIQSIKANSCPRRNYADTGAYAPKEIQIVMTNLVNETTRLIAEDMKAEKEILRQGGICAHRIGEIVKAGKKIRDIKRDDFKSFKGQSPSDEDCLSFVEFEVPRLSKEVREMRQMMAIAFDPGEHSRNEKATWGQTIVHDKPFTEFITSQFFPSVWKKGSMNQLHPLSEKADDGKASELEEAQSLRALWTPEYASMRYYQLIAESQILLFFDDKVTPETIAAAYSDMLKQNEYDFKELEENPKQDILLLMPYLEQALQKLPISQRGDACLVVSQVFKNLNTRYVQFPQFALRAGLILSIIAALRGSGSTSEFAALTTRYAGFAGTVYGGINALNSMQKYSMGASLCQGALKESRRKQKQNTMDLNESGYCEFTKLNELYRDGQNQALVGAISIPVSRAIKAVGSSLYGMMRTLRSTSSP